MRPPLASPAMSFYTEKTAVVVFGYLEPTRRRRCSQEQRTRLQPIRTAPEISTKIVINPLGSMPLYQKLARKINGLLRLGMSVTAVAKSLHVSKKTAQKAKNFYTQRLLGGQTKKSPRI